jgi:hypothetical protein
MCTAGMESQRKLQVLTPKSRVSVLRMAQRRALASAVTLATLGAHPEASTHPTCALGMVVGEPAESL